MKIILFGIVKDLLGKQEIEFDLKTCNSITCLKEKLVLDYPELRDIQNFAFAVNETYATLDTIIEESDIVAIIPPVSGG